MLYEWDYNNKHYHITQREDRYYVLFGNDKEMCSSKDINDLIDWCLVKPIDKIK